MTTPPALTAAAELEAGGATASATARPDWFVRDWLGVEATPSQEELPTSV